MKGPFLTVAPRLPLKISTVCLELNEIIMGLEFHNLLREHKELFAQSNIDGPALSAEIMRVTWEHRVQVRSYTYPWYQSWRNRKVTAHVKEPTHINLTNYFLGVNDDLEYAETIGHELVHIVDLLSPYWFGHGDNDPSGDELTAPHIVGHLVAKLYKQRRDRKVTSAARAGEQAFDYLLKTIGATDKQTLLKFAVKGVHDHGTEYGTAKENSNHVAD